MTLSDMFHGIVSIFCIAREKIEEIRHSPLDSSLFSIYTLIYIFSSSVILLYYMCYIYYICYIMYVWENTIMCILVNYYYVIHVTISCNMYYTIDTFICCI
jgi:hypothetical protein